MEAPGRNQLEHALHPRLVHARAGENAPMERIVVAAKAGRPDLKRGFRVPFVPVFPIIGILLCCYLMRYLDRDTWIRFVLWLIIGLGIYFAYGIRHSRLREGEMINPEADLDKP
jgi:amino acid transporter